MSYANDPSAESDDLAPARGCMNGVALGGALWAAIALVIVILIAGCSTSKPSDATESPESDRTTVPVQTDPPAVSEAPVATQPPVESFGVYPPVQINDDGSVNVCGMFWPSDPTVSSLTYTDYDEYCSWFDLSFNLGATPAECAEFWNTSDEAILDVFMSPSGGGHSHDGAVGIIDALWINCS